MSEALTLAQEYGLALIQRAEEALQSPGISACSAYLWKRELLRGRAIYHHINFTTPKPLKLKESFNVAL